MPLRSWRLPLISLLLLVVGPAVGAPPTLTRDQARGAVDGVIKLVEAHYVFPDKRAAIAGTIKQARDGGRYDVTSPHELGERVSADLLAASADGHLSMSYDPEQFAELRKPDNRLSESPFGPEVGRQRNDGYEEQKVLAGNVRYVRVSNFMWFEERTPAIIDAAARFLGGGDAVIVDLRGNGGGSAESVQRLVSYFFPGAGQELMRFHDGISGQTSVNRVLGNLPAPRLNGRPFYVLIDGGAGSASEEFAYHVQQFKLGTLVGRTTAGAANNNQLYPIAPFFVASISVGRPEHPVSRTNWEGVGVAPHIETPTAAAALDQAHLLALRQLAQRNQARRGDYEWEAAALEARLQPQRLPDAALDAYVGTYGIRRVWREGPRLMFQREKREPTALVSMGPDMFGFENSSAVRLKFRRANGRVVGFDQVSRDGVVGSAERTG
jgi:hypothetical protein